MELREYCPTARKVDMGKYEELKKSSSQTPHPPKQNQTDSAFEPDIREIWGDGKRQGFQQALVLVLKSSSP